MRLFHTINFIEIEDKIIVQIFSHSNDFDFKFELDADEYKDKIINFLDELLENGE